MVDAVSRVVFWRDDPSPLVDALGAAGPGDWINVSPDLDPEAYRQVPTRTGLAAWFSGRGPAVAMATWMPAEQPDQPVQLGVAHGTGPNALARLEDQGCVLPATWRKQQDHAKHGIVALVPPDADRREAAAWMLDAVDRLMSAVPAGDRWVAEVYGSS